jgi:hypothetical protein
MTRGVSQLEQMEDGRGLVSFFHHVSVVVPPPLSYGCMSRVGGPVKGEERRAGP